MAWTVVQGGKGLCRGCLIETYVTLLNGVEFYAYP